MGKFVEVIAEPDLPLAFLSPAIVKCLKSEVLYCLFLKYFNQRYRNLRPLQRIMYLQAIIYHLLVSRIQKTGNFLLLLFLFKRRFVCIDTYNETLIA